MKNMLNGKRENERGMALIVVLLAMMLLLGLGIAVVSSATNDNFTNRIERTSQQAFFAADAGIGIARQALVQALQEKIEEIRTAEDPEEQFYKSEPSSSSTEFPDAQVVPDPDDVDQTENEFYVDVFARALELTKIAERDNKMAALNGSSFAVTFQPLTGSVTRQDDTATEATEVIVFRYSIQVTGQTEAGGSATVNEAGKISINLSLVADEGDAGRNFAFSGFGAFFDFGDTNASSALAAGTFSGPVHTNTHFAFNSGRNVTFRNLVTQVDSQIRKDSSSLTSGFVNVPATSTSWLTKSSEGYKTNAAEVPLPENNFSQEYAVINRTGITDTNADGSPVDRPAKIPKDGSGNEVAVFDGSGQVRDQVLAANLRTAKNQTPTLSGGNLPNGVYISSSDGATIDGAGIYVQGDADDIQLLADPSGCSGCQNYVIKQGSTTTTIQVNYTANTTKITSGSDTKTYTGTFTDMSVPETPKQGASLFVNGSILALRGGKSSSTNKPAIASKTALTVTANRHITVTGDLKYTNPVANSDGTPVSNINTITNVLGIFTNDGNLKMAPVAANVSSGLSLEMHAAVVSFNAKTSNDGSDIEGSIVYTGGTSPGSSDKWKLVGSRVQSKINNISYSNRDIFFDVRYSGGNFSPPFFPGTTYNLGEPPPPDSVKIATADAPAAAAISWFRDFN
jgi:hypothetical protein